MTGSSLPSRMRVTLLLLTGAALAGAGCGGGGGSTGPSGGNLNVSVTGLPTGTLAAVVVTGPGGFSRNVTASTTLQNLDPGTYTAAISEVDGLDARFASSTTSVQASVAEGGTASLAVTYVRSTGALALTIAGLPGGAPASVLVSRGGGFSQVVTASTTITKLTPGVYQVEADTLTIGSDQWFPSPAASTVNVTASETPATRTVTYMQAPAVLTVTITGMPPSIAADVTVTGPGGFSQGVTATTTLTNLVPGTYTIAADTVTSGPDTFAPLPLSQGVALGSGANGVAAVAYTSTAGTTLNLDVPQAYLVQAIQRPNGTAGLVAGRDALLRVFVRANQANTAQPVVRVTFYQGATPVSSVDLDPPGASVPQGIAEGSLSTSWNYQVDGSLVQPGLELALEVDPDDEIAEAAESDNAYPAGGGRQALDVATAPTFEVVFVPVTQNNGLTGDVSAGNADSYLDLARRIHPFGTVTSATRIPYVTTRNLSSGGGNWSETLGELQAVKLAESDPRYWYGVVKVNYGSGVAGIGYVAPNPTNSGARTALGWDAPGSRDDVAAHEWGHNLSRLHAPCGDPSGIDPAWPTGSAYSGAKIGVFGYDQVANTVKSPSTFTDIMGYCSQQWISDYTWQAIRGFRGTGASVQPAPAVAGLLVWGRLENGRVTLEPAFALTARPTPAGGSWTLEAVDAAGAVVARHAFEPLPVADLPGDVRHFTLFVPLGEATQERLAELRVAGPGGAAALRATEVPPGAAVQAEPVVERRGAGARVRWSADRHPAVLVRDAATGRVLSIARGGEVTLPAVAGALDLVFSDGVRSTRLRRAPR